MQGHCRPRVRHDPRNALCLAQAAPQEMRLPLPVAQVNSRHNCKYARWKSRAVLWFWETDYGDSASLGNLI